MELADVTSASDDEDTSSVFPLGGSEVGAAGVVLSSVGSASGDCGTSHPRSTK